MRAVGTRKAHNLDMWRVSVQGRTERQSQGGVVAVPYSRPILYALALCLERTKPGFCIAYPLRTPCYPDIPRGNTRRISRKRGNRTLQFAKVPHFRLYDLRSTYGTRL